MIRRSALGVVLFRSPLPVAEEEATTTASDRPNGTKLRRVIKRRYCDCNFDGRTRSGKQLTAALCERAGRRSVALDWSGPARNRD